MVGRRQEGGNQGSSRLSLIRSYILFIYSVVSVRHNPLVNLMAKGTNKQTQKKKKEKGEGLFLAGYVGMRVRAIVLQVCARVCVCMCATCVCVGVRVPACSHVHTGVRVEAVVAAKSVVTAS